VVHLSGIGDVAASRKRVMYNAFGIVYSIIVGVGIIVFLDWLAERKDRRSHKTTR